MSNHLAIAHVTASLGKIALAAAKREVSGANLSFGPPDASDPSSRVNLYLYQVVPNAARRNDELPTRGNDGKLVGRPRTALDLHFLFSFHGKTDTFEPERMAGAVARELHTNPVLDSERLSNGSSGADSLQASDLPSAPDRVRVTPITLSLEELSRLWSVLVQKPHVLSLAYEASMVLIDALTNAAAALPVLRRGSDGRGAIVGTDRVPRLESAWIGFTDAPARSVPLASLPAAALGTSVVVEGSNLEADALELVFSHPERPPVNLPIPPSDRTAARLEFRIPDDPAAATAWAAGLYSVTVKLKRDGKELASPLWPFMLAPRLSALNANPPGPAGAKIDVTASLRPQVGKTQKAVLRAGAVVAAALARGADTDPVIFRLDPAPALAGEPVRIEIDGVESLPVIIDKESGDFAFDPNQRLSI
jgi:hypothetical protein